MSFENQPQRITLPKAADFSTKQFLFGKVNSSGQVAVCVRGDAGIGVIDDNGSVVGSATPVIYDGVAQVMCGGNITAGDLLMSDVNGKAVTLGSADNHVMGVALESGAANAIIAMLVQPRSLS